MEVNLYALRRCYKRDQCGTLVVMNRLVLSDSATFLSLVYSLPSKDLTFSNLMHLEDCLQTFSDCQDSCQANQCIIKVDLIVFKIHFHHIALKSRRGIQQPVGHPLWNPAVHSRKTVLGFLTSCFIGVTSISFAIFTYPNNHP